MADSVSQSEYTYHRTYRGNVQALILDWSGTTLDAYVLAPAIVFVEVFANQGIEITMEEARGPMGLRKDLHIKELTEVPKIRDRWAGVHGRRPDQSDVDRMFEDFVPAQLACLADYTTLLPGVAAVTKQLQAEGIKIGSSTGFFRSMVDILVAAAKEQGYTPDAAVAGDDVIHGARPKPFMVYRNLDLLDVHPIQAVVKVDDTVGGVGEALEAGCWGVGIARYANDMNIDSLEQADSLSDDDMQRKLVHTREKLARAGAHYVIDEFDELPSVLASINERLAGGERP